MEDIEHLLNSGEVPDLFTMEEKAQYVEELDNIIRFGYNVKKKKN